MHDTKSRTLAVIFPLLFFACDDEGTVVDTSEGICRIESVTASWIGTTTYTWISDTVIVGNNDTTSWTITYRFDDQGRVIYKKRDTDQAYLEWFSNSQVTFTWYTLEGEQMANPISLTFTRDSKGRITSITEGDVISTYDWETDNHLIRSDSDDTLTYESTLEWSDSECATFDALPLFGF
ncbi:hypothetical protein ACFL6E_07905 [Candidatus Neomarinimicrobiota bacterium]